MLAAVSSPEEPTMRSTLLFLCIATAAVAQTQPAPDQTQTQAAPDDTTRKAATEEIVVTGTRVRRKDLNTPAPVTVLSRDQITAAGRVSIGEFLQALPEQGNSGANAQVNNGNDGSIFVSLRSLGPQRTLVLVNGRRMVPGGTVPGAAADLQVVGCLQLERRRRNPLRHVGWRVSRAGRYESILRRVSPVVPRAFFQPFLYLSIRKP